MEKSNTKPTILLSNDDGIAAPGLFALYQALSPLGNCVVVAPETESSGVGHAITVRQPLRLKEHFRDGELYGYSLSGTPVDCIKFAVDHVLGFDPDLIVSGINQGSNTAINAFYSGTTSAAAEGGIMNIPSIAVSITSHDYTNFSVAAEFAQVTAEKVISEGLPDHTFLNINVPPVVKDEIAGVRITRMGRMRWKESFDERTDPSNKQYFWLKGKKVLLDYADDSDEIAVSKNFIAVAPLICDLTNYKALDLLNTWNLSLNNKK